MKLPGDKSLAHRLLILAAIQGGKTSFANLPLGDDILTTLEFLRELGCTLNWESRPPARLVLDSPGFAQWSARGHFDCDQSGTTLRLMVGVLSAHPYARALLRTEPELAKRPIQRLIDQLTPLGACVTSAGGEVNIFAPTFSAPTTPVKINVPSAQMKSALLLFSHCACRSIEIESPKSRDHTERIFAALGGRITCSDSKVHYAPSSLSVPKEISIPGDTSIAALWAVRTLMLGKRPLKLENILLNYTRLGWARILKEMGADLFWEVEGQTEYGEDFGSMTIAPSKLCNINLNVEPIGFLIDEIPLLGILGAFSDGVQVLEGAEELKLKESDRLVGMIENFRLLRIPVLETESGWKIQGQTKFPKAPILFRSYGDHRLSMAWSLASMKLREARVDDTQCITKSYPEFSESQFEAAQ